MFGKYMLILVLSEGILAFLYNFINPSLPHLPGDIYIDKSGFRAYIPMASAIILAILLSIFLHGILGKL
jgi:hypothetical protein